jgi:hypothetical protein
MPSQMDHGMDWEQTAEEQAAWITWKIERRSIHPPLMAVGSVIDYLDIIHHPMFYLKTAFLILDSVLM